MYMNIIKPIIKGYNKLTNIGKIMIWITLFLIIVSIFNNLPKSNQNKEGYENRKNIVFKDNTDLYDDFYVNVYDEIFYNDLKDDYQVGMIVNKTSPTSESRILDLGCGSGNVVKNLNNMGYKNIIAFKTYKIPMSVITPTLQHSHHIALA